MNYRGQQQLHPYYREWLGIRCHARKVALYQQWSLRTQSKGEHQMANENIIGRTLDAFRHPYQVVEVGYHNFFSIRELVPLHA